MPMLVPGDSGDPGGPEVRERVTNKLVEIDPQSPLFSPPRESPAPHPEAPNDRIDRLVGRPRPMLRATLKDASYTDQQKELLAHRIGKEIGMPDAVVRGHLAELARDRLVSDTETALGGSHRTADWVWEDLRRARLLYPDLPLLTRAEKEFEFANLPRAFASGWARAAEGVAGTAEYAADIAGGSDTVQSERNALTGLSENLIPESDGFVGNSVYQGVAALGQMAPAIGLFMTGAGASAALAYMGITAFGSGYGKSKDKGAKIFGTPEFDRPLYAALGAATEVLTERNPAAHLTAALAGKTPLMRALKRYWWSDLAGEQAATAQGDLMDAAAFGEGTLGSYLADRPGRALETAISTAVASAGLAGTAVTARAAPYIYDRARGKEGQSPFASEAGEILERAFNEVKASRVLSDAPELFDEAIAAVAGNAGTVYVDGSALAQQGIDPSAFSTDVRAQLSQAEGGLVAIPAGEYQRVVIGGGYHAQLRDDIKFDPDMEFTVNEAKQWASSEGKKEFDAEMSRSLGAESPGRAFWDGVVALKKTILDDLNSPEAGITRMTGAQKDTLATLRSAYFNVRSAQVGLPADQLYKTLGGKTRQVDEIVRDNGLAQSSGGERKSAWASVKRIDSLLREYASSVNDSHTKSYLAWVDPAEFLKVSSDSATEERIRSETTILDEDRLAKESQMPFLDVNQDWVVTDHEGRHRMSALAKAGVRRAPVVINTGGSWRELYPENVVYLRPSAVGRNIGTKAIFVQKVTPLSYGSKNSLYAEFSGGAQDGVRFARDADDILGAFNPTTLETLLSAKANASTPFHELQHHFIASDVSLTRALLQRKIAGQDIASGGEKLVEDVAAALRWAGAKGETPLDVLADWSGMKKEDRNAAEEKFAEAYERYLLEGKAPSLELSNYFDALTRWIKSVYRTIRDLVKARKGADDINPAIRGYFDRQIATDEQIDLARTARSLIPLFKSLEASGMTPENYAAYQSLFAETDDAAKSDLRKRAVPNMLYAFDIHSKALAAKRAESAREWANARAAATEEVMRRPVYQAWKFLTDPVGRGDAAAMRPPKPEKTSTKGVDPRADSMFTAIAKLGGINWDSLQSELGIDPAYKSPTPVFGKRVWTKKGGGVDVGGMIEYLAGYHYLTLDEHGKPDHREFEEKFLKELNGEKQYAEEYEYERSQEYEPGAHVANPWRLKSGRLDPVGLIEAGVQIEEIDRLKGYGMVAKSGGLSPDQVSGLFQDENGEQVWTSGAEMASDLLEAVPLKDAVERLAASIMESEHSDLVGDVATMLAADEAVHNDIMTRLAATEHAALTAMVETKKPTGTTTKTGRQRMKALLPAVAREFAREAIRAVRVGKVNPRQYASAGARASRASARALDKGDIEVAAAEKRNHVVQLALTREAYAAQKEYRDAKKLIRSLGKAEVRKKLSLDYLRLIDAALEGFGVDVSAVPGYALDVPANAREFVIRRVREEKAGRKPEELRRVMVEALAEIEKARGEELPVDLPAANPTRNIADVTVGELRDFIDSLEALIKFGRDEQNMHNAADKRAFDDRVAALTGSIISNAEDAGRKPLSADQVSPLLPTGQSRKSAKQVALEFVRNYVLAYVMDNGNLSGEAHQAFQFPAQDATSKQQANNMRYGAALMHALKPVMADISYLRGGKRFNHFFSKVFDRDMTNANLFVAALNLGNESSARRLVDGENSYRAGSGKPEITLDDIKAEVARHLTGDQIRALQKVWDLHAPLGEEAFDIEESINHKRPEKVEPVPVTLKSKDGEEITLPGGYYPVMWDFNRISKLVTSYDDKIRQSMQRRPWATVDTGRLTSRVEKVTGMPLRYDIEAVGRGFAEAIHHNAWRKPLIGLNKLINNQDVRDAIHRYYGPDVLRAIGDWLEELKQPAVANMPGTDSMLSALRLNVSVSSQMFNLISAAVQVGGLTNSLGEVELPWMMKGAMDVLGDPAGMNKWAMDASQFMEHRGVSLSREQYENTARMRYQYGYKEAVSDYGFILQRAMQKPVDLITFRAAYLRAEARLNDAAERDKAAGTYPTDTKGAAERVDRDRYLALHEAEQAVKITQGSGQAMDLSKVEVAREATKLLTLLMNYSLTTNSLGYMQIKSNKPLARKVARLFPLMIMSVLFEQLLRLALQANGDPDEPEDWERFFKTYAVKQALFPLSAIPGARELASIAETKLTNSRGAFEGPVGMRLFWDFQDVWTQLEQGENDVAARKAIISLISDFLPIPGTQINRTMSAADAMSRGRTDNPMAPFFGYRRD